MQTGAQEEIDDTSKVTRSGGSRWLPATISLSELPELRKRVTLSDIFGDARAMQTRDPGYTVPKKFE